MKLHKKDMEEYKAQKATQEVDEKHVDNTEQWNSFWKSAAKIERKKRRRPLTVKEAKRREFVKAKKEIVARMEDTTRPMCHLFDNPIFDKGFNNPEYE